MSAQKHLYDSIILFINEVAVDEKRLLRYRHLLSFKDMISDAKNSEGRLIIYESTIRLNSYILPKINMICAICNHKELLKMNKEQIISLFFDDNIPIGNAYEDL